MITITLDKSAEQTRVKMSGELDIVATTNQTEELNNVLEYISSAGLRFFMQLKRESEAKGGSIRLTHLNEDVADIFRMSGFKNIFEIE